MSEACELMACKTVWILFQPALVPSAACLVEGFPATVMKDLDGQFSESSGNFPQRGHGSKVGEYKRPMRCRHQQNHLHHAKV